MATRADDDPERDGYYGKSRETQDARRDWEFIALRKEIAELRKDIDTLNREKEKALRWGIMTLGAAVLGMGIWIFNLITAQIK